MAFRSVQAVPGVLVPQAIAQDNMNDVISNIAALIAPEALNPAP